MTYVITQNCCKDASCVPVCPVDCIRPVASAGEFTGTEMLYIDPNSCIDCGACQEECPVGAIYADTDLPPELERFQAINEAYFEQNPLETEMLPMAANHPPVEAGSLRVAVVGAGPAACYTADELVRITGVEVDLFERLPTPYGLVRAGVAPDHLHTKSIVDLFAKTFTSRRMAPHFNVEIGEHLSHEDLLAHHHAVVYAVGASNSRELGIPGETLAGNCAASDFVGWYNGHPDRAVDNFDLSGERVVIVGNGNVALDVARMLLLSREQLHKTDIAEHALEALADSGVREVVILARRGPREAAFSAGEFLALGNLPGIDIVIESDDLTADPDDDVETALKLEVAREYAEREQSPEHKRIVFRFMASPVEIVGDDEVTGIRVLRNTFGPTGGLVPGDPETDTDVIETSLVLRSIGYRGTEIAGLPYDVAAGVVPNDRGRVLDADGVPVPGVYVSGWIKRGPRGVIGTNRTCAEQTVGQIWEDFDAGRLTRGVQDRDSLEKLLHERGVDKVEWQGWKAIDAAERSRGSSTSRPRVKFVSIDEMLSTAKGAVSV
ncbi:FAD-dependent oxidoreductase [Aldersonia sp. NBC_00410]|uniref:FAD-dependent oxidoreductase n=1 Tax=Aldersonia sp. NBC_00410 TaxID=2975954 RepID=UPI00225B221F|nr:FAD-dependent oxidoreductase [Aldersonia sp. NBC_00410]MCX5045337.1 FAD-dependent oxidoreductase [Aldersonia sp. NBC_00410]